MTQTQEGEPKTTVTLEIDGKDRHTIETKALNVICHQDDMDIRAIDSDVLQITPEDTVKFADNLIPEVWATIRATDNFRKCWDTLWNSDGRSQRSGDKEPPQNPKTATLAVKHTIGMILLIYFAAMRGKRPFLRYPETYLHPKQQAQIADMLRLFTGGES